MVIGPPFQETPPKHFEHMVWLRETSQSWDRMESWLLQTVGAGRGGDIDLIADSDQWFLGWHGTYPALYFVAEDSAKRFRAFFAISPEYRLKQNN